MVGRFRTPARVVTFPNVQDFGGVRRGYVDGSVQCNRKTGTAENKNKSGGGEDRQWNSWGSIVTESGWVVGLSTEVGRRVKSIVGLIIAVLLAISADWVCPSVLRCSMNFSCSLFLCPCACGSVVPVDQARSRMLVFSGAVLFDDA